MASSAQFPMPNPPSIVAFSGVRSIPRILASRGLRLSARLRLKALDFRRSWHSQPSPGSYAAPATAFSDAWFLIPDTW